MAIVSDYGTLKAEMTFDLFHPRLVNRYDSAIHRFETSANTRLRVRQQEWSEPLTCNAGGTAGLPADYLLWRAVQWYQNSTRSPYVELDYVHPAYIKSTWIDLDHGNPKIFSIIGNSIRILPVDDTINGFALHYYKKIPTIVTTPPDNAATNWLITEYPNAYIFGVMCELAGIMRNAEMAQLYKARRDEAFAEIIQLSALTTGPAAAPQQRTAEYF